MRRRFDVIMTLLLRCCPLGDCTFYVMNQNFPNQCLKTKFFGIHIPIHEHDYVLTWNAIRTTGTLWGESNGPSQRAGNAELWCFFSLLNPANCSINIWVVSDLGHDNVHVTSLWCYSTGPTDHHVSYGDRLGYWTRVWYTLGIGRGNTHNGKHQVPLRRDGWTRNNRKMFYTS